MDNHPLPPYEDGVRSDSVESATGFVSRLSFPPSKSDYAPRREWPGSVLGSSLLSWLDFPYRLYRWSAAFRSFRAHIRIQSPKMGSHFDLGPLGRVQDGRCKNHERIQSRAAGIETMRSGSPWVDSVDIRLFLLGWDAGEKYSMGLADHHTQNTPDSQPVKG